MNMSVLMIAAMMYASIFLSLTSLKSLFYFIAREEEVEAEKKEGKATFSSSSLFPLSPLTSSFGEEEYHQSSEQMNDQVLHWNLGT